VSKEPVSQEEEKRTYLRYRLLFPVTLTVADEEVVGVCRDASAGGALIAASAPLEPGAEVVARFRVSGELRDERTIRARVVRQELSEGDLQLAFPYCIALEFASPAPDLLDDLGARSERSPT
jgi:hypothetical protein